MSSWQVSKQLWCEAVGEKTWDWGNALIVMGMNVYPALCLRDTTFVRILDTLTHEIVISFSFHILFHILFHIPYFLVTPTTTSAPNPVVIVVGVVVPILIFVLVGTVIAVAVVLILRSRRPSLGLSKDTMWVHGDVVVVLVVVFDLYHGWLTHFKKSIAP